MLRLKSKLLLSTTLVAFLVGCGGSSSTNGGTSSKSSIKNINVGSKKASISGIVSNKSASVSKFLLKSSVNADSENINIQLMVDLNQNGEFGDEGDIEYNSFALNDGTFLIEDIVLADNNELTNAQLVVKKEAYAPVNKIVELQDGQSITIKVEVESMPIHSDTVTLPDRASSTFKSSYLKLGMKNTSNGITSYAKIMSLSQLKAEADDPSFGEDEISQSVIPLGAFPESVKQVRSEMKAFDPTKEDEVEYFPGEFKGEGKTDKKQRLVSVGFDLVSLKDQNGDDIKLDTSKLKPSKLSAKADYDSCLQTKRRYLSEDLITQIEKLGDDDTTQDGFQVPMWYYNYNKGFWDYLGSATYVSKDDSQNGRAYADMCVKENWGKYLNLDYAFTISKPKSICIKAKDQNNEFVSNLTFTSKVGTAYNSVYSDHEGKATLVLKDETKELTDYLFSYSGNITSWKKVSIDSSEIIKNTTNENCDYSLNLEVLNPYSTELIVTLKNIADEIVPRKYISLKTEDRTHYKSAYSNSEGKATFKIKPDTKYIITYANATYNINANATIVSPEISDNKTTVYATLKEKELAPIVRANFNKYKLTNNATSAKFYVNAKDHNGDEIKLKSITLNNVNLEEDKHFTILSGSKYKSYESFSAKLDLKNTEILAITPSSLNKGNYELKIEYVDSKNNIGSSTAILNIVENTAPVISSIYLVKDSNYFRIDDSIEEGTYTIKSYSYDINGDEISLSYQLNDKDVSQSVELAKGQNKITIIASDGTLETKKDFEFFIGDRAPEIYKAGTTKYRVDVASNDNTFKIFAYIDDKEDGDSVKKVEVTDSNGKVYNLTKTYNKYLSDDITLDRVGDYNFKIVAIDSSDNESEEYIVNVVAFKGNQAPIFIQGLASETIDVGTNKEFICEAKDPENSALTYIWKIDEEIQSSTTNQFTHTFDKSGQYVVECQVSDGEKKVSSIAKIQVSDKNETGVLTVKTKIPNIIVALNNNENLEYIKDSEKKTDSNGNVSFDIKGDRTTFSISMQNDLIIPRNTIFDSLKTIILGEIKNYCYEKENCKDICDLKDKNIPLDVFKDIKLFDFSNNEIDIESLDTNKDNYLDNDEIYNLGLAKYDKDKNGSISVGEYSEVKEYTLVNENKSILSQIFWNIPVREYTFNLDDIINYYGGSCNEIDNSNKNFNVVIKDLPISKDILLESTGSGHTYLSNNTVDGSLSAKVYNPILGKNNKYSILFYVTIDDDIKYYLYEGSKDDASSGITLSYEDFKEKSKVVTFLKEDESVYNDIYQSYNGLYFNLKNENNKYTIFDINNSVYYINGYKRVDLEDNKYLHYTDINYYELMTLPNIIESKDYPHLDITPTFKDKSIILSGSELAKVDLVNIESILVTENENIELDIFSTKVSKEYKQIEDINKVLPESLAKVGTIKDMTSNMNFIEFKELNESEILENMSNSKSSDFNKIRTLFINLPSKLENNINE